MRLFGQHKRVYLDYAASTPVDAGVSAAMEPYEKEHFGNPGSVHAEGQRAERAVSESRATIARILGAHADEIIFTSGGTEANNMAIFGTVPEEERSSSHVITSVIEHPSVLEPVRVLAARGVAVSSVGITKEGRIDRGALRRALRANTRLVSVMYVNNEIGSVQPIAEVVKAIRKHRRETDARYPYMHTDASQAPLFYPLSVEKLGVDLLTLDAQKVYGPKGVGLLYKKRGVPLAPLFYGGDQEMGVRPGTENVPLIVGFAKALELAEERRSRDSARLEELRDAFIAEIQKKVPHAVLNGSPKDRAPNNVNISIPGLDSTFMMVWLDARGIACGSRSACVGEEPGPSEVIRALGKSDEIAKSSLRFTLGRETTTRDIEYTVRALQTMVKKLTRDS